MSFWFQCVIIFLAVSYKPPHYGAYYFPEWANSIGWALAFVPVSLIPLVMIIQLIRSFGSCAVSIIRLSWFL